MQRSDVNPYASPGTVVLDAHDTDVRHFPLKIRQCRRLSVIVGRDELWERMDGWALELGYRLASSDENRRDYERGSFLRGLFAWDIRDIPSTVIVDYCRMSTKNVCIELRCTSRIGVVKPGDVSRLLTDLDRLEFRLLGGG